MFLNPMCIYIYKAAAVLESWPESNPKKLDIHRHVLDLTRHYKRSTLLDDDVKRINPKSKKDDPST